MTIVLWWAFGVSLGWLAHRIYQDTRVEILEATLHRQPCKERRAQQVMMLFDLGWEERCRVLYEFYCTERSQYARDARRRNDHGKITDRLRHYLVQLERVRPRPPPTFDAAIFLNPFILPSYADYVRQQRDRHLLQEFTIVTCGALPKPLKLDNFPLPMIVVRITVPYRQNILDDLSRLDWIFAIQSIH